MRFTSSGKCGRGNNSTYALIYMTCGEKFVFRFTSLVCIYIVFKITSMQRINVLYRFNYSGKIHQRFGMSHTIAAIISIGKQKVPAPTILIKC